MKRIRERVAGLDVHRDTVVARYRVPGARRDFKTVKRSFRCPGRLNRQEILAEREFSRFGRVGPVLYANIGGTPWPVEDAPPSRST